MYDQQNPDDAPPPPQSHRSFLADVGDEIAHLFRGRNDAPPPQPEPHRYPVVDSQLTNPPYPEMAPETLGRYQQEVRGCLLTAGVVTTAHVRFHTRPDFYAVTCYPAGAVVVDANDGVWVGLSATPPGLPIFVAGQFQHCPYRVDPGETVVIHGAEQELAFTLDSTIDLVVIVTANTSVRVPWQ